MATKEELRDRLAAFEDAVEEVQDILAAVLDEDEEEEEEEEEQKD